MKKSDFISRFAIIALTVAGTFCRADAATQDQTLLSGMPGYKIESSKKTGFGTLADAGLMYCAPSRKCNATDIGFNAEGKLIAEGEVTAIRYETKGEGSTLAVARNYEAAIQSAGGRKVTWNEGHEGTQIFLLEKEGQRTWVVLENYFKTRYKLTYIEEKKMQQVVTANQMATAIGQQGYATIYINFANNSALIQPDAKPALNEIVALLANDKSLRLSIEGHTDNVGNAVANKKLSQDRAINVVQALIDAKVDSKRLQAKGWGSEAPIADNRNEDGRAKNRRVELVKLK
ncbi:OmpA family protein [Curvibacter sp. RS43]|uniref:OmpA family protein n=1 Tax=Curvibacter microcysteis TaxID=3026419 RepID=UPI002362A8F8|nr:OmpA family protein [Curvibacter sp. RS43]MDD0812881.1 OmpA family protein [Curvibacter sp. RS43]